MKTRIALGLVAAFAVGQLPVAQATRSPGLERPAADSIAHVRSHAAEYGVDLADLADLRVTDAYRSAHNGVAHVYLRQQVADLDVMTGEASVAVLRTGEVFHVAARFLSDVAERASGEARISPTDAVRAAAAQLGLVPDATLRVVGTKPGADRPALLSPGGVSKDPIPARLVYQPAGERIRLAWELIIHEKSDHHWWELTVDAETGEILSKHDYVIHETITPGRHTEHVDARAGEGRGPVAPANFVEGNDGAEYTVFALPYESPNDGPRTTVTNPSDPLTSPFGWHDVDGQEGAEFTRTQGNNVHAFWDVAPGVPLVETERSSEEGLEFDHPLDLSLTPQTYVHASITNLFYWNNVIHDVFARYGFDEAAGNFQEKNYQDTGLGSDSVNAQGQDGTPYLCTLVSPAPAVCPPINNANFGTPRDGQNPTMQMYLWSSTAKRNLLDGDFDAGVITHEYGHGISNRLTGGPTNVSCLRNEEQAGEGWSDFFGVALTTISAEEKLFKRGLGTYVLGQADRTKTGIRDSAYWTRSSAPTYNNIKTAAAPHGVGWVWASMLWDMYWKLVDAHGFNPNVYEPWNTGGNNLAIQLVVDGLKFQPCSPGFVDSRNGILAADAALTGGQNQCLIWEAFARRGLGYGASQGSAASKADGVESKTMPPTC